ncbi:protein kinase [Phycicoccus sp. HDW14]|uniref:protein kinase domain-containing protein n=1 Tax=Phycicoccus sp. HDW14 TaxID=2714941 RepID=UPI00140CFED7|nr:protein kinase [Phycicoccus sp. HDW14]QIM20676.1 protein kinase [Phycicoccus sp. HDW14]
METTSPPQVPGVELGALLGRGGGGEVWEGVLLEGSRPVAVKVTGADAEAAEAAVREASVAARVAAEHVLGVLACTALPDGRVALVMPLMRGGSLAALVRARGHLGPGEVVTVLAPLAGALGRLHAAGVVHGDVSPGNVLLDLDGRPVLADLGVGRVLGEAPAAVWGTPGHLAPEVLMGAEPSPASDVYALGALGWLCLAGEVPGAPGLRPGLASVCRAGSGSEALVAAVEAAVHPRADERPGADELAWLFFGAAEPEPLHLVAGDDDVSAVTYRLRAAAGRAPGPPGAEASGAQAPARGGTGRAPRQGRRGRGSRGAARRRCARGAAGWPRGGARWCVACGAVVASDGAARSAGGRCWPPS